MQLTPGTISALYNSQTSNPLYKNPVVQLLQLTKVNVPGSTSHRYKANISDGKNYMKAVFATEVSNQIFNGMGKKNDLIKIGNFSVRPKDVHLYLYVQSVLEYESKDVEIGNPTNIGAQSAAPNQQTAVVEPKKSKSENPSAKRQSISTEGFTQIKDINPFLNKWSIKGRVVSKSDIRKFNTKNGEGKLFSFEIADASMQCKVVAFSDSVDIFYPIIENNKVFIISGGTVKMANKQYSSNNFDYEIHLEKNSDVQLIEDDDIPMFKFSFKPIGTLAMSNQMVDVVGIIKEIYPLGKVTSKSTGKELIKRELIIVDQTGQCRLTLWGAKAEEELEKDSLICLKSVKVGEYNGITLSSTGSSQIISNIDIPEAIDLLGWYKKEGKDIIVERPKSVPRTSFLSDLKNGSMEYGFFQGSILYLKEDSLFYPSCLGESCNKKVSQEDNGTYRCERCNYTYDSCNYRYMLSFNCGDFTGQSWLTAFDEVGQKLFGMSAKRMMEMKEENPQETQTVVKNVVGKDFTFKVRVKDDIYNGENIKRITCLDLQPLDIPTMTKRMLEAIEKVSLK